METGFGSLNAAYGNAGSISRAESAQAGTTTFDQTKLTLKPVQRDWTEILQRTIQAEIIPHILSAQHAAACGVLPARLPGHPGPADIVAFVNLIIADDMESLRTIADRVIVLTGGREALLHELLTPAAQLLGEMWTRDICDFTAVTLGVLRLDQLMKETASGCTDDYSPAQYDRSILLLPAPGEQHSFGLNMVADAFREGGWCVRSGPGVTRAQLARLVRGEWFDVVGLSVTSDRCLAQLPGVISFVRRASCNPDLGVFIGGRAVAASPGQASLSGADKMPNEPRQALAAANIFVEASVTKRLHQSKTELVDIG
jgi:methanogenic corrinoid protein MtbC1